ncbi:hypothetical protein ACFQ0B_16480 [Nonomuraea thailandensis]
MVVTPWAGLTFFSPSFSLMMLTGSTKLSLSEASPPSLTVPAISMPMTLPSLLNTGPPELPW